MILPISCRRFGTPENRWMRSGNHDMSWVYHKNKLWRAMKTGDLLPWYTMIYLLGKLRFLNLMIMVYICMYIYIYRMTIVCYGFSKYEWEYDVVPCSIPQWNTWWIPCPEYKNTSSLWSLKYVQIPLCSKHGFWGCWIFGGLDLSHIHEPGLTLITCLL